MIYVPALIILYLVGFYTTSWIVTRQYRGESVSEFKRGRGSMGDSFSHADATLLAASFWPLCIIGIITSLVFKGPIRLWHAVQMNALKPGDE